MTKILIVSDSHGRWEVLRLLVRYELPDIVFHLGDVITDAKKLQQEFPELPIEQVPGNCDGWGIPPEELTRLVMVDGVKFLLTHGHLYQAKSSYSELIEAGKEADVDAVLFGHTHKSLQRCMPDGMWLINPGTVGGIHAEATYGVIEVEDREYTVAIKRVASILDDLDREN